MPIYKYACPVCSYSEDYMGRPEELADREDVECPQCGEFMLRKYGIPVISGHGYGWCGKLTPEKDTRRYLHV